ncbi:YjcZ family sporulation protein [Brevibacillus laterosporus]|uniref:YjcZ family sporulation protein n=1 Tax=Brevibacillus laterosporus TaxID=1465 RepID=UPI0009F55132
MTFCSSFEYRYLNIQILLASMDYLPIFYFFVVCCPNFASLRHKPTPDRQICIDCRITKRRRNCQMSTSFCGNWGGGSFSFILVLFILLVIISCTCCDN